MSLAANKVRNDSHLTISAIAILYSGFAHGDDG